MDQTPLFLETRIRQAGRQHTPASPLGHDASTHQGSFARPAFADIGAKLKACNDTLGNLQQLGIQHVAKLPELVLVGDQSAGKSSLMSGLAELNLPRSGGVCTRCPIHIRMASSNVENFSCTVSLQLDYDYKPHGRIRVSDVTKNNPFPPWVKKPVRETKFFKSIEKPDDTEIEEILKWAQVAILNPNQNPELFVPGEGAITKEVDIDRAKDHTDAQFSPNIVALEMKGPGLPDLSFYDLPGVFLSPGNEEDEYIVKVVQNLASAYIQREEAIIMWAVPMNHDLENSIIFPIIRRAGAQNRTIGVITKADMLQESNVKQWLDVVEGKKQRVKHGYFMTSLPPDQPLEKGTHWEESFFQGGVSTWPREFEPYVNRCGVDPLRNYISLQLGEAFSRSLPFIKVKVQQRLQEIQEQLSHFPELPSNVEYEVMSSFGSFLRQVKADVKDRQMSSKWDQLNEHFKACIIKAKPGCNVTEEPQTIELMDSDADSVANTPSKRPRASDSTIRTPASKRPRPDIPSAAGMTPIKLEPTANTPIRQPSMRPTPPPDPSPFARFAKLGRGGLDLREIRQVILDQKKAGMPADLVPESVYEFFSLRAVRKWREPLEIYLEKTRELLLKKLEAALENSLKDFKSRLLYKEMSTHLRAFLDDQESLQRARLFELYDSECYQMFTMTNDICDQFRTQELDIIERARAYERLKANALLPWDVKRPDPATMSSEAKVKERKMLAEGIAKIPCRDQFATEIKVAAHVRAYYLTAATFFVEGVTKDVNSRLFRSFTLDALDRYLGEKLGIMPFGTREAYARLMEEDAATARERENLKKELAKLERAMHSINELESEASSIDVDSEVHMLDTSFLPTYTEDADDEDMGMA
ncbi:P-loop containing nucleoside triphosphate hydrolase protein [Microdochium trichocladiopsis]|uniref:P-loop containing nucleoside triphosphate hydrolase protein n=1 Tax=Microdochium trichocladiopsis TaxID=1682393 RepID=A0A9P8Y5G3_9PEZI|nr:P-loop containing nucleoside triphosphate hydrolase protein [Microdochium trichocladiopsis]KAH7027936.1 P-loop containing nucleoside triphosphate hydrolase protein [Microdochium trichocladiopsis]